MKDLTRSFLHPRIAFDSDNNLYIADTSNSRVQRIAASDGTITTVNTGSLNSPRDVAFDNDDNLYIADAANNRIQRIAASDGTITTANTSPLSFPAGIALDNNANIYATDTGGAIDRVYLIEGPDTTNPTATITSPTNNARINNAAALTATFTCTDAYINTCTATLNNKPINNGDTIPTTTRGSRTLIVTATDNYGNTTATTIKFTVYGPREITGIHASTTGVNGSVARLYMATFKRQPDNTGHTYWVAKSASELTISDIAGYFVNSPEFKATYANLTNKQFVELLYVNVMNRTGDTTGITYWTGVLDNGTSRANILIYFSESAEFKTLTKTS